MDQDKLRKYLSIVQSFFDVSEIISEKKEQAEIKEYYITNHLAYLFFHNKEGFMHMGISQGNKYQPNDLLTHLQIISTHIQETGAKRVLELGAGNGSNSLYLASRHSETLFEGVDLSKQSRKSLSNYKQQLGDFHTLERFPDESYDTVFVIEALCHSNQKEIALQEVYKKLKKGGRFIIFDAYTEKPEREISDDERVAKKLIEKTMAVDTFEQRSDFEDTIKKSGFQMREATDYSLQIMPSLTRFEKLALRYFEYPFVTKVVQVLFPEDFVRNSIAGLLMLTMVQKKVFSYYIHVLQKE